MRKKIRINLLVWIIISILLGVVCGQFFAEWLVRLFLTFNSIFSNFLSFAIPLIILGFVTPAISEIGKGVGRMLVLTIFLAYGFTVGAGLLSYFTSVTFFPVFLGSEMNAEAVKESSTALTAYFTIPMPPLMEIMTALILSFVVGVGITVLKIGQSAISAVFKEFRDIMVWVISKIIVPFLPLYIFGIFLNMTHTGEVAVMLKTFFKIIVIIFLLHIIWLIFLYILGALFSRKIRNPFKLLWLMLPAYFTALGTQSSAATIPVTLKQTIKMGVSEATAGFTVPLCATIDLSGSALKIVACALALMMVHGFDYNFEMFFYFISMMGITLVAAPGVPGGAIMAALGLLSSILGFSDADNALMIALYITMDSFGTACNVTGDGAISLIVDRFFYPKETKAV